MIFALLSAVLLLGGTVPAQILPGQIIRDVEYPQWLLRSGGDHVFLAGPGDPEDFLYRGTRLLDGTRDGDQIALIDKLAAQGGNTLYAISVLSHGGDGDGYTNPFIEGDPALGLDDDILDQWETWFDHAESVGLVILLFVYDDSTKVWETEPALDSDEITFLNSLVDRFEHHPALIWFLSEESEEARSDLRARQLAAVMAAADDHDHLIGNHHHTGTAFKSWADGSEFEVFAMHNNVIGDQIHTDAAVTFATGVTKGTGGNAYLSIVTEVLATFAGDTTLRRHYIWDSALGGVASVTYGMDIENTPDVELNQCQYLIDFMQAGPFWELYPHDARAAGITRWVLGSEEVPAIAYTREPVGDLGLTDMLAGTVDLHWVDCVTGVTVDELRVPVVAGTNFFTRPLGLGDEVALWVQRSWEDLGQALAGSLGEARLTADAELLGGTPITIALTNAPPSSPTTLVVGVSELSAPFKLGVMVPALDWFLNIPTDAQGGYSVVAIWPAGVPGGIPLFIQAWFADAGAPFGFAASNALSEVTP